MENIDIQIKLKNAKLIKGNYEGYDYYKITAETEEGLVLSKKLTQFEYNTLKALYV